MLEEEEPSPSTSPLCCEASPNRPPSLPLRVTNNHLDPLIVLLSQMQDRQHSTHRSWFTAGGPHAPDPSFIDGIRDLDTLCLRRGGSRCTMMAPPFPPAPPTSYLSASPNSSGSSSSSTQSAADDIHWLQPKEEAADDYNLGTLRRARKQDINVMFHLAITDAVEWGSQFPIFSDLPIRYKRELLKEYSIGFMLVDQGYNTSKQHDETLWILQHDKVYMCTDYMQGLPKKDRELPNASAKAKIHPDFVVECIKTVGNPMREIQIELFECVVLKSLLLFECFNVYPRERRSEIATIRERCLNSLAAYESMEHPHDGIERIGTILLMIANIRNCILVTSRQIIISDVFSHMKFEPLVSDVLLNNNDDIFGTYA